MTKTKKTCRDLRKVLVASGPAALRGDDKAEEHLVDCAECFAFLEALAELEKTFAAMPSHDAPDDVVERLLASPELASPVGQVLPPPLPRSHRAAGAVRRATRRLQDLPQLVGWLVERPRRLVFAAGPVLAVVVIGLLSMHTMDKAGAPEVHDVQAVKQHRFEPPTEVDGKAMRETGEAPKKGEVGSDKRQLKDEDVAGRPSSADQFAAVGGVAESEIVVTSEAPVVDVSGLTAPQPTPGPRIQEELDYAADDNLVLASPDASPPPEPARIPKPKSRALPIPDPTPDEPEPQRVEELRKLNRQAMQEREVYEQKVEELRRQVATQNSRGRRGDVGVLRDQLAALEGALRASGKKDQQRLSSTGDRVLLRADDESTVVGNEEMPADMPASSSEVAAGTYFGDALEGTAMGGEGGLAVTTDGTQARNFLAQQAQVDGVSFQDARGYWANTYVPGDWELRQLQARLSNRDRGALEAFRRQTLRLHDGSHQAAQPFDSPDNAALAVYLHADRRGLVARERMLVEVGLQATSRRSGRRGAMNVGVVLDLRGEVPVDVAASMRALVEAFSQAHDLGDRFSLIVAGKAGGLKVPAGDFRHGPLTVAMGELFGDEQPTGQVLGLDQALHTAFDAVSAADDPTTPLGSSVVVLVTGQELGSSSGRLAAIAHGQAVEGVPMSVVGIGTGVRLDEIDRLVLAGQGNRRLLQAAAGAEEVVDRELSAVARVVARAVRLRIRLAPGVQLVNVIGSENLDEARAQEVRDAEISIDRRLSRNLGIQADRGLDEEGIQIVIPTFYADDSHVVLLDVVSPGPGPVADVTVRYKDLVWLKNGVARDHLSLGRSEAPPGPLELNVLKNLLARRLGETLENAGQSLAYGDRNQALTLLQDFRTLLLELTVEVAGFESDPDLRADIAMLDEYIALLEAGADQVAEQQQYLVDSLNYAGRLKVLPTPAGDGE